MTAQDPHLSEIRDVKPSAKVCEDCLEIGDRRVNLRLCRTCGHADCCDSSKNRRARAHFRGTKHPIVRSLEPGEDWRWGYADEDCA